MKFLLSVSALVGIYLFVSQRYAPSSVPTEQATTVAADPKPSEPQAIPPAALTPPATPAVTSVVAHEPNPGELDFQFPFANVSFSKTGGCISKFELLDYKSDQNKELPASAFEKHNECQAYGLKVGDQDWRNIPVLVQEKTPNKLVLIQENQGIRLTKTFLLEPFSQLSQLQLKFENLGTTPLQTKWQMELGAGSEHQGAGGLFTGGSLHQTAISHFQVEKVTRTLLPFEKTPTLSTLESFSQLSKGWYGAENMYFLAAVVPQFGDLLSLDVVRTGYNFKPNQESEVDRTGYEGWLGASVSLEPGASRDFSFDLFIGPKLKSNFDKLPHASLSESIDFGFFKIVAWPMFYTLQFLYKWVGNWGTAIVILTLLIKILFIPLTIKAYVAGKKMQKLQPEMAKIKEKHKDGDKRQEQQEIMQLMSKSGANPLSGCLPILPQIPVFFGLNAVLLHTFELRHAPFYFWFQDLASRDPLYISPAIMAALMFVQQKMTPLPAMDPAQAKMMQFLPIIFAIFMFSYPSGLVLYIITNTLATMVQQKYMMAKYSHL